MEEKILFKELSYKIVGCFYKVYNELGPGHKESIYQNALRMEFEKQNIDFTDRKRIKILYDGKQIGIYEPDFVVEDKIIVEIKSVFELPKVHEKQLFYYLKGAKYRLGYLVNFGSDEIDIRRRIV